MRTPPSEHRPQQLRVSASDNQGCNALLDGIKIVVLESRPANDLLSNQVIRRTYKVRQSPPYLSLLLLNSLSHFYHLGVEEPVLNQTAQRFNEAVGQSEGHPLRVRQPETCVIDVLEVNVDDLTVISEENVVWMSVP